MISRKDLMKTTIGRQYIETGNVYGVDVVLEYLFDLMTLKKDSDNKDCQDKYELEIRATKEILKLISK